MTMTAEGIELQILHTNDLHAHLEAEAGKDGCLGMAEIIAVLRALRQKNPDTLIFDAGDMLHGTPLVNSSQGKYMVEIANQAGYDAMTIGNHEFIYGAQGFKKLAEALHFPVLCANIYDAQTGKYAYPPYKIFHVHGLRLAVFGLTTPDTTKTIGRFSLKGLTFQDPIEAARQMVQTLRTQCDGLIALTHLGIGHIVSISSRTLAQQVAGIDLIIDGHSHDRLPRGMTVGKTLIVQTGAYGKSVGVVRLLFRAGKIISQNARLLPAREALRIASPLAPITHRIQEMEKQSAAFLQEVIAHVPQNSLEPKKNVRKEETWLGDLIADAFRIEAQADIGVVNAGNVRADLPQGNITRRDVMAIFPFGNILVKQQVTGAQLRIILEQAVATSSPNFGGFLQVSGLVFFYHPQRARGQRITKILVQGQPLVSKQFYTLATNDFLASGGEGYQILREAPVLMEGASLEDTFIHYVNTHGTAVQMGRIYLQSEAK